MSLSLDAPSCQLRRRERARFISNSIRQGADLRALAVIKDFDTPLDYGRDLKELGISDEAWILVRQRRIDPRLVFAHPTILMEHPGTSLYYRGITTLSLKRVQQLAGSVKTWEQRGSKATVSLERARKVACLFNRVTSELLEASTSFGHSEIQRNIIATMGSTLDGTFRNLIGQSAEKNIKSLILGWLEDESGIPHEQESGSKSRYLLGTDHVVRMEFSSEPDIGFYRRIQRSHAWQQIATIEIKGGTDPAGALERLGAIKKSFDVTPAQCKNFLILGVVTESMTAQMNKMHIAGHFLLSRITTDQVYRDEFLTEIFHHALRLLDSPFRTLVHVDVDRFDKGPQAS